MATRGEAVIQSLRGRTEHARPAREAQPVAPPELGVLDRRQLHARRQGRQARALVTISVLCVGVALLLASVGHALVASDQIRSDHLSAEISTQLAAAQNHQLQRAALDAPVRIETIAENQLNMVTPTSVTYLVPVKVGETVAQAHQNPTAPLSTAEATRHPTTKLKHSSKSSGRSRRRIPRIP